MVELWELFLVVAFDMFSRSQWNYSKYNTHKSASWKYWFPYCERPFFFFFFAVVRFCCSYCTSFAALTLISSQWHARESRKSRRCSHRLVASAWNVLSSTQTESFHQGYCSSLFQTETIQILPETTASLRLSTGVTRSWERFLFSQELCQRQSRAIPSNWSQATQKWH